MSLHLRLPALRDPSGLPCWYTPSLSFSGNSPSRSNCLIVSHLAVVRRVSGGMERGVVVSSMVPLAGIFLRYVVIRYLKPKQQSGVHAGLLAVGLATLLIISSPALKLRAGAY